MPSEQGVLESQREKAKNQRRVRIVEAAYALLRERDISEITVVTIAERASVHPATVYNLFGTKDAIVAKVYERDLEGFEARVASRRAADALERLFGAVTVAANLYRDDTRFYRATMGITATRTDAELADAAQSPRTEFWQRQVQALIAEGLVRPDTDAELIGLLLIQIAAGALNHWIMNLISVDRLELETKYGFATVLLTVATKPTRERLERKLATFQRALKAKPRHQA